MSATATGWNANPVNLITRVRLHHKGGDEARSLGGLDGDADLAEEEIVTAGQGRCIARLPHAHGGPLAVRSEVETSSVVDGIIVNVPKVLQALVPAGLCEVKGRVAGKGRVWGAICAPLAHDLFRTMFEESYACPSGAGRNQRGPSG